MSDLFEVNITQTQQVIEPVIGDGAIVDLLGAHAEETAGVHGISEFGASLVSSETADAARELLDIPELPSGSSWEVVEGTDTTPKLWAPDVLKESIETVAPIPDLSGYATDGDLAEEALMRANADALLAPLESPALTGNPTAPTQDILNNSTRLATTAFVQSRIADLVGAAPTTLDQLNELAAALGNDANFSTTILNSLSGKGSLLGGNEWSGAQSYNSSASFSLHPDARDSLLTALGDGTAPTGTGALARANSPAFVTPNIGAATGTSLTTTGGITTSAVLNALAVFASAGDSIGWVGRNRLYSNGTTVTVRNTSNTANGALACSDLTVGDWASVGANGGGFNLKSNGSTTAVVRIDGYAGLRSVITQCIAFGPAGSGNAEAGITYDGAHVVALRNATNAQTLRLYNTYTDANNYERGFVRWNANILEVGPEKAGTGADRAARYYLGSNRAYITSFNDGDLDIFINAGTSRRASLGANGCRVMGSGVFSTDQATMLLGTSGGTRLSIGSSISSATHLIFTSDNTHDIGASGATRPRNAYFGGFGVFGSGVFGATSNSSGIQFTGNGTVKLTDNGSDFDRLQFGGTTSAFPALKRSGATLQARLADDSGFADLSVAGLTASGVVTIGTHVLNPASNLNLVFSPNGTSVAMFTSGGPGGIRLGSTRPLSWSSISNPDGGEDLSVFRDAPNTLAQRNGTNAQTLRVYNTYTDASNYERVSLGWAGNEFVIGTEAGGTGATRTLRLVNPNIGAATGTSLTLSFGSSNGFRFNADNARIILDNAQMQFVVGNVTRLTLNRDSSVVSLGALTASGAVSTGTYNRFSTFNHTTPSNGDFWFDGADFKFHKGGSTNTLGAGGGGSLSNWTESTATFSGQVSSLFTATNAATNVNAAILPKGNGAFILSNPDGTTAGGNTRGNYVVDLQRSRTSATKVAAGHYSVICGGEDNLTAGSHGCIGGGSSNTVGNSNSCVTGGYLNNASANFSTVVGGRNNTASGVESLCGGSYNTASAQASVALGYSNTASGLYSLATGMLATTRGIQGVHAHSAGQFVNLGDAQAAKYLMRGTTTNNTITELSTSGAPGSTSRITLPNNHAYKFRGQAIARETSTGDIKTWDISGSIKRGASAAATAIVGTVTITEKDNDAGAAAWTLTVGADTTNGSLRIQGTGETSKSIRWLVEIETLEIG